MISNFTKKNHVKNIGKIGRIRLKNVFTSNYMQKDVKKVKKLIQNLKNKKEYLIRVCEKKILNLSRNVPKFCVTF